MSLRFLRLCFTLAEHRSAGPVGFRRFLQNTSEIQNGLSDGIVRGGGAPGLKISQLHNRHLIEGHPVVGRDHVIVSVEHE